MVSRSLSGNSARLRPRKTACERTSRTKVPSAVFLDFGMWAVGVTVEIKLSFEIPTA